MAWLQSPDGTETVRVPDEQVPHYVQRGAKIVGPPEQPLEANPISPIDIALMFAPNPAAAYRTAAEAIPGLAGAAGRAAVGAVKAGGKGLGGAAARVFVPGAGKARDIAELASEVAKLAGRAAPEAAAPTAAGEAATQAAEQSPRAIKEATAYWRRRAFATLKEAGVGTSPEESRAWISGTLGKDVGSRANLSMEDWVAVHDAALEKIANDAAEKAAAKAAARVGGKAAKAAATAPTPEAGAAPSRIPGASPNPPRGASRPELARRGSALARIRAAKAPPPQEQDLEQLLQQSIDAARARRAMAQAGG